MMEDVEAVRRIDRDLERLAGLGVAHRDENLAVRLAPQQRDVDAIAAAVVELSQRVRDDARLIASGRERILGDRLQVTRDFVDDRSGDCVASRLAIGCPRSYVARRSAPSGPAP